MLVCPFCGREYRSGVRTCPDCRAAVFFEATDARQLDLGSLVAVAEAGGEEAAQLAEVLSERGFLVRVRPPAEGEEEADRHAVLVAPEQSVLARTVLARRDEAAPERPRPDLWRAVRRWPRPVTWGLAVGAILAAALWVVGFLLQEQDRGPVRTAASRPALDDLLASARRALEAGDRSAALAALNEAGDQAHTDPPRLAEVARLLREAGEVDAAIQMYAFAVRRWPTPEVRQALGNLCLEAGRNDQALAEFEAAAAQQPMDAAAHLGVARACFALGRWERAAESARKALAIQATNPGALLLTARLALADERVSDAEAALRTLLTVAPADPEARVLLGTVYRRQHRLIEAERQFLAALDADPRSLDAVNRLGLLYQEEGRLAEAAARFEQALAVDPRSRDGHYGLGLVRHAQGEWSKAIEHFEVVLSDRPGDAPALRAMGMSLSAQGRADEAVEAFKRALALEPHSATARQGLGLAHLARRDYPAAEAEFKAVIAAAPNSAGAYQGLGLALAHRGRLADAIEAFAAAIRIDPEDPEPHYQIARLLEQDGQVKRAVEEYVVALRLAPDHLGALNDLALVRATAAEADLRRPTEAIQLAGRAVRLAPGRADLLATLAEAYFANGDLELAIDTVKDAVQLAPYSPVYRRQLERYQRARPTAP